MTNDITLVVPSSLVREAEDKREATRKLGYVARAATIYRAKRVVVFPDREGETRWGGEFVRTVLAYAATPPYLKHEVWGKRDELRYAGILPPLRVSTRTGSDPDGPESREGIVTEVGPDDRVRVNCGLQHPISLLVPPSMAVEEGERVTVRVSSREPVRAKLVDEAPPGFTVEGMDIQEVLARDDAGVRIGTSRHGGELTVTRLAELGQRTRDEGATFVFGSPGRGLPEMLGVSPEQLPVEPDHPGFDLWLNTVPNQGSEVVRTEEAVFATLAPFALPK
jgi:predicted SPOUT superfamily RNA methylase MTH1